MKKLWLGIIPLLVLLGLRPAAADAPPVDDRAAIRTQLAAEYFKRRQFGVAIEEAQKAIAANPKYASAYGMLALIYMELQEDAKARDNFRQALVLAPNDSDTRHNFGYFLCERGEYQAGITEYMAALRNSLYQTPDKTLTAAGYCAEKDGKAVVARGYYERALRYQADNQQAKYRLASLMFNENQVPEARRYALELVRTKDPQPEALWLVLRIERKLGNKEAEQRYAEQLRRQHADSLETSKLLAGQFD